MEEVSWNRTERSVGKNCVNWSGRNQRGLQRKNSVYLMSGETFDATAQDVCVPGYAKKMRQTVKREPYLKDYCQLNNHYMIILMVTNLVDISSGRLFVWTEFCQKNKVPAM